MMFRSGTRVRKKKNYFLSFLNLFISFFTNIFVFFTFLVFNFNIYIKKGI